MIDRPGHDHRYAIDATKLEDELGWRAREDFASGIRRTVTWYLNNEWWWKPLREGVYSGERLGLGGGEDGLSRMRIAVTGQNGQVARALSEVGGRYCHEVVLLGRPALDLIDASTILPAIRDARRGRDQGRLYGGR